MFHVTFSQKYEILLNILKISLKISIFRTFQTTDRDDIKKISFGSVLSPEIDMFNYIVNNFQSKIMRLARLSTILHLVQNALR